MLRKINTLMLFTLPVLLFSCNTSFQTVNINSAETGKEGIIYTLPKTKINISIEITEVNKQKGPFADFAHLYFNTDNAVQQNSIEYYITDISLKTVPISDPDNIYSLIPDKNNVIGMVNLTPEGFLAGINLTDYQAEKVESEQKIISKSIEKDRQPGYGDLSLKSVRETKYDTLYKEVLRDSVIIKVPVISKKDIYKSDKKQAKEIADILFLLRDDRNALLIGENDGNNFPDGQGLKLMLQEINELEKQYMSLFVGREIKTKRNYEYEIIPNADSLEFRIAGFDRYTGISKTNTKKPILLKLFLNNASNNLSSYTFDVLNSYSDKNKAYNGLIYRIPGNVSAEVYYRETLLYKKNIKVSQLGSMNIIPEQIFDQEINIEFYPQNGSLKRISKFKSE